MVASLLSSTASMVSVQDLSKSGNGGGNGGNGRHYHRHPRIRGGARLAALRAYSGAMKVLKEGMSSSEAADWVGSNANYVRTMITIIESKDEVLLNAVLEGKAPVLVAAAQVEGLTKLLAAFKVATAAN